MKSSFETDSITIRKWSGEISPPDGKFRTVSGFKGFFLTVTLGNYE